jgi:pyrroloquinoline quinone biosynthesis protein D
MTSADLQLRPKLAPQVRLQTDPVTGEPVLLFPEGLLELNSTAHDIVTRCDGAASIAEIISALAEEYDASPEMLSSDVIACLEGLREGNLIILVP